MKKFEFGDDLLVIQNNQNDIKNKNYYLNAQYWYKCRVIENNFSQLIDRFLVEDFNIIP